MQVPKMCIINLTLDNRHKHSQQYQNRRQTYKQTLYNKCTNKAHTNYKFNKQTQQQNLHIKERKTKGKTIIKKTKKVTNVPTTPRFQRQ